MSQVDFGLWHMLSSNVPSSAPAHLNVCPVERETKQTSVSAPASRSTTSECSPNLWCSDRRHPKCHCSWNTIKCFCSCCCPLKILAASMTAAKISQALPFTCQQGLKIVQVASAGHCLAYLELCIRSLGLQQTCGLRIFHQITFYLISIKTLFIQPVTP